MATREIYIEVRIPLNGEMFDDAEKISALKTVVAAVQREAAAAFGANNFTISTRIKSYRSKADAASFDAAEDEDKDAEKVSISDAAAGPKA